MVKNATLRQPSIAVGLPRPGTTTRPTSEPGRSVGPWALPEIPAPDRLISGKPFHSKMGLFPEIFQKILDHTVEGEHLRHFTAMRCAQRSHTNMTRAVRRISARSPHTALVGAQHQRGLYHVLEGGHLLLAEHRLDEREDALARGRAGRDGKGDARRERPRRERLAVDAPPLEDRLGECVDVGRAETRR